MFMVVNEGNTVEVQMNVLESLQVAATTGAKSSVRPSNSVRRKWVEYFSTTDSLNGDGATNTRDCYYAGMYMHVLIAFKKTMS